MVDTQRPRGPFHESLSLLTVSQILTERFACSRSRSLRHGFIPKGRGPCLKKVYHVVTTLRNSSHNPLSDCRRSYFHNLHKSLSSPSLIPKILQSFIAHHPSTTITSEYQELPTLSNHCQRCRHSPVPGLMSSLLCMLSTNPSTFGEVVPRLALRSNSSKFSTSYITLSKYEDWSDLHSDYTKNENGKWEIVAAGGTKGEPEIGDREYHIIAVDAGLMMCAAGQ